MTNLTRTPTDKDHTIARLNDQVRKHWHVFPHSMTAITAGIRALPLIEQQCIFRKVQTFDAFTPENDPTGHHDFGAIDHGGQRVCWKIDYYDHDMESGSEDPADYSCTMRVLTIFLAQEY